ncbi:unnamed protein product [Auanema sp. JU1783]|nr:unnamed protein product [Auanema sp. JU1783]
MSRWDSLPVSTQNEENVIATTFTSVTQSTEYLLRNTINGLIRQEISDSGQNICYYQRINSRIPVPYVCNLGCCNQGCCTVANLAATSSSFGWAVGLLCLVIIAVIFGVTAIGAVYLMNKQKDRIHKQQLHDQMDGSTISQEYGYRDGY